MASIATTTFWIGPAGHGPWNVILRPSPAMALSPSWFTTMSGSDRVTRARSAHRQAVVEEVQVLQNVFAGLAAVDVHPQSRGSRRTSPPTVAVARSCSPSAGGPRRPRLPGSRPTGGSRSGLSRLLWRGRTARPRAPARLRSSEALARDGGFLTAARGRIAEAARPSHLGDGIGCRQSTAGLAAFPRRASAVESPSSSDADGSSTHVSRNMSPAAAK